MEQIKEYMSLINIVVGVLLIPLIRFLFDMRLKIERLETIINIVLKEVELLKKHVEGGNDDNS